MRIVCENEPEVTVSPTWGYLSQPNIYIGRWWQKLDEWRSIEKRVFVQNSDFFVNEIPMNRIHEKVITV